MQRGKDNRQKKEKTMEVNELKETRDLAGDAYHPTALTSQSYSLG